MVAFGQRLWVGAVPLFLLAMASGCAQRSLGKFTVLAPRDANLTGFCVGESNREPLVSGTDSRRLVFGIPSGQPSVSKAACDALAGTNATCLTDAEVRYKIWLVPVGIMSGETSYDVEGRPVKR